MTNATPLPYEQLSAEDARRVDQSLALMGFVSNDALTMARVPGLLAGCAELVKACYAPGTVDLGLKRRMAYLVSRVSGCRYCQAHTANGAGLRADEIDELWHFETCATFNAAEKAALMMAREAGTGGESVADDTSENLRQHYDDSQLCELAAILSLFAFLNRWNTLLATELEDAPRQFRR